MKKLFFIAVAGLSLALAACSGKKENKEAVAEPAPAPAETTANVVAYTGVIPAADRDGDMYALDLTYNEEGNAGTYQLTENYFTNDTTATEGYVITETYNYEGNFEVKTVDDKSYITLYDNEAVAQANFLVDSDSTITMVNAQLEVPATPDYTLTVAAK